MADCVPLVILGSSRRDGETRRAISLAFGDRAECLDLSDYTFSPYDYGHSNRFDDFPKIIDLLIPRKRVVLATPVYWYAMSAIMKAFFDRLSDLVTIEKQKGRALAGKTIWLIATGTDPTLPEGFEVPFLRTCTYFDWIYRGACYLYANDDQKLRHDTEENLREFGDMILQDADNQRPSQSKY
jgi:multimeric flavodoxin WrbA